MDGLVSQIELDPTSLSASDSIIVDYPIPAAVRSFGYLPAFVAAPHLVCSQLYADAYLAVTRRVIAKAQTAVFTPAHLSATPRLHDVPVTWVSIS